MLPSEYGGCGANYKNKKILFNHKCHKNNDTIQILTNLVLLFGYDTQLFQSKHSRQKTTLVLHQS